MPGQTGGIAPSRWGLRGSEDLGDGLRATFVLEAGFSPDKGTNDTNQGGRAFGRQAWVGVSGRLGTLSLGRQYTMYFWSMANADTIGPAIYSIGSLDAALPGARSDNTLAYLGSFSDFTFGATHSLGRDVRSCAGETSNSRECNETSLMAKFEVPKWGVSLAYDEQRGGTGGLGGLNGSNSADRRIISVGYVQVGPVKLTGGQVARRNGGATSAALTARSRLLYAQADWAASPLFSITSMWSRLEYRGSADNSGATLLVARASYRLSKRTSLYVMGGRMANDGSANFALSGGTIPTAADGGPTGPGPGRTQTGFITGIRHTF